jgi:hypothetical protein
MEYPTDRIDFSDEVRARRCPNNVAQSSANIGTVYLESGKGIRNATTHCFEFLEQVTEPNSPSTCEAETE